MNVGLSDFLTAFSLVMIFEGITPFLSPKRFKHLFQIIADASEATIRLIGFFSMFFGIVVLYIVR